MLRIEIFDEVYSIRDLERHAKLFNDIHGEQMFVKIRDVKKVNTKGLKHVDNN